MSAIRSKIATSVISFERFADNGLPTNRSVVNHYQYLRKNLGNLKFLKKSAVFADVKQQLVNDVRLKAGLPVVSEVKIFFQCKDLIDKDEKARRKAKERSKEKEQLVCDEGWGSLFDSSNLEQMSNTCNTSGYLVRVDGKVGFH